MNPHRRGSTAGADASSVARTAGIALACAAAILALSLGIRHTFGLFLQPMSMANGWGREVFALAIAMQNLVWGVAQPFTGMIADRFGAKRVILGGGLLYVAGLALMAQATTSSQLLFSAGLLLGLGLSGTTFAVVFGAVSRAVTPERRSFALGVVSAAGSFGQFVLLPGSLALIDTFGWIIALVALSALAAMIVPAAISMPRAAAAGAGIGAADNLGIGAALAEAGAHRGFWLLSFGFFVCGFQTLFIGVHLPAYLVDRGMDASTGAIVLALIGLFNIAGNWLAGVAGGRWPKPRLLTGIYIARAVVIAAFVTVPVSPWTAYLFGAAMGFLWLNTVPLTNGTVATIFGLRNFAMLAGIVFFVHQIGAFLGGWLGGRLFDATGSYGPAWAIAIGMSLVAAALNWPIREVPVARLRAAG